MRRAVSLGLAVVAGLPLLSGCSRNGVRPGEARLDPHGVVEVAAPNQAYARVTSARLLHEGDRVRVQAGTADLRLSNGALALRDGSELLVRTVPELLTGDLLVVTGKTITVRSAGSEAAITGAARLSRDFAVTAASYAGALDVRSAGANLRVSGLRQAVIPALGQLPRTATPLQYRDTDAWDRRFLSEAIDLGVELQARSDGATAQFRDQGRTAGFYRTLFPVLDQESGFSQSLLDPARPPGEHIVGTGIALAATRSGGPGRAATG
jgi:hypothetical protein